MFLIYFYDAPVYRFSRDDYYRQREEFIETELYPGQPLDEQMSKERERNEKNPQAHLRTHLADTFGGAWEFNEVIGYIRLHFLGTQVRGEYFANGKTPIRHAAKKTRKKQFCIKTEKLVPEVDIDRPYDNVTILAAIQKCLERCRTELPKAYIDDKNLLTIIEYVDWSSLLNHHRQTDLITD